MRQKSQPKVAYKWDCPLCGRPLWAYRGEKRMKTRQHLEGRGTLPCLPKEQR